MVAQDLPWAGDLPEKYNHAGPGVQAMIRFRILAGLFLGAVFLVTAGCGGHSPNCGPTGLNVGPATATIDHTAAPPLNTQPFSATLRVDANNGCAIPLATVLINSNWTASDPSVQLSASPSGQVGATCTKAVAGPVTTTATQVGRQMFTGTAALTCN